MSAKVNIIEGARLHEVNGRIMELVRMAHVYGLTVGTGTNVLALALADAGVPAAGSTHPDHSELFLVERNPVKATAPDEVTLELIYRWFGVVTGTTGSRTISGGSGIRMLETAVDNNGQALAVPYVEGNPPAPIFHPVTVQVPRSQSTIRFARVEVTNGPGVISKIWTGRCNSLSWQGGNPLTWLCTAVNFSLKIDSSPTSTYDMSYDFQYQEETWAPIGIYKDKETGEPPPNVSFNNGIKDFPACLRTADFNVIFP